jgi:hypothetical protein
MDAGNGREGSWRKRSSSKSVVLAGLAVAALGGVAIVVSVHQALAAQTDMLETMQQQL